MREHEDEDRDDRIREDRPRRKVRRSDDEYDNDSPPRPKAKSNTSKVLLFVFGGLLLFCCVGVGVAGALLYPFYTEGKNRQHTSNDLKVIGIAMHNYHDQRGHFPPVHLTTREGKPGLSWRVELLPTLGHDSLYRRFKLDEPWDGPTNRALLAEMPTVYADLDAPAGATETRYRVFGGPGTPFERPEIKLSIAGFTDGTSNTILVAEAEQTVPWTKPEELRYDPKGPLPALNVKNRGGATVVMGDGSTRVIRKDTSEFVLRGMITHNSGEVIPFP